MTETSEELLRAARQGDAAATEALVRRHAPLVTRFARAMCPRPEDAEDVAQEALMTAVRGLGELRTDHVESWLYVVIRSFCGKTRRRRKGQPAELDELVPEELVDLGEGPERAVQRGEEEAALQRAVRQLDPDKRAVLVLRDLEGLPTSQVAAMLGLSPAAVKSRLFRARAQLREEISAEG